MGRRKSRLQRHTVKENRKQAFWYIILSIGFVFFMIRWGVPLMVNLLAQVGSGQQSEQRGLEIRPQKPEVTDLPEATFSAKVNVVGVAGADVKIRLSDDQGFVSETETDSEGKFEFANVELKSGENKFFLVAIADKELESETEEVMVIQDKILPEINIVEPQNEAEFSGSSQKRVVIKGSTTEPDADIYVNNGYVYVNSEGKFEFPINLEEGVNELVVKAVDKAGNVNEKLLRLRFSP